MRLGLMNRTVQRLVNYSLCRCYYINMSFTWRYRDFELLVFVNYWQLDNKDLL